MAKVLELVVLDTAEGCAGERKANRRRNLGSTNPFKSGSYMTQWQIKG